MESYKTQSGEIDITFFGHSSLMIQWNGRNIYADPWSDVRSFRGLPKGDLFLITHDHFDHYDHDAIGDVEKKDSVFLVSRTMGGIDTRYKVLKNGDAVDLFDGKLHVQAVPAYNIKRHRPDGRPFHAKGDSNGYILSFGDFRIYIAGDTEETPDMQYFPIVDIAFLPNDPVYTMSDEDFIACANKFRPKYLYPYHCKEIDVPKLRRFLDTGITLVVPK
jgi:L-ascorbate metabolism protein UlaG (beta-lactamase superfamily)